MKRSLLFRATSAYEAIALAASLQDRYIAIVDVDMTIVPCDSSDETVIAELSSLARAFDRFSQVSRILVVSNSRRDVSGLTVIPRITTVMPGFGHFVSALPLS